MPDSPRIRLDRELCIGAGTCAKVAPGVFALDDEELARVVDPEAASTDAILDAAARCPTGAIYVDE
ncbi:MAG TPA: ferredoxin [Gaiellaceae bacterium]|nr:ferredoxin [Gaiellaceae bacterium]